MSGGLDHRDVEVCLLQGYARKAEQPVTVLDHYFAHAGAGGFQEQSLIAVRQNKPIHFRTSFFWNFKHLKLGNCDGIKFEFGKDGEYLSEMTLRTEHMRKELFTEFKTSSDRHKQVTKRLINGHWVTFTPWFANLNIDSSLAIGKLRMGPIEIKAYRINFKRQISRGKQKSTSEAPPTNETIAAAAAAAAAPHAAGTLPENFTHVPDQLPSIGRKETEARDLKLGIALTDRKFLGCASRKTNLDPKEGLDKESRDVVVFLDKLPNGERVALYARRIFYRDDDFCLKHGIDIPPEDQDYQVPGGVPSGVIDDMSSDDEDFDEEIDEDSNEIDATYGNDEPHDDDEMDDDNQMDGDEDDIMGDDDEMDGNDETDEDDEMSSEAGTDSHDETE